ncbi:MAG: glycosyltransferase family 2 protein [Elusimicrobiota bacterium]
MRLLSKLLLKALRNPAGLWRSLNARNLGKLLYYLKFAEPSVIEEKVLGAIAPGRRDPASDEPMALDRVRALDFPARPGPLVSIIIPAWNHWRRTYRCLDSLLEGTRGPAYEVIVVDNASTDETPAMLARVRNVKVLRNPSNRGFGEACNQGAAAAGGKYVLFLNNDTRVREGWLEPMAALAEGDGAVGAVGAKLLFPDGRLQEAGCILWNDRDNLCWTYGRFQDPERPEYNYVKEVDYCSAACLMVRKVLFDRLGGFDLRYAPAYCEDADLAMGMRKLGYKVLYQPRSEVVHEEGATSGADPGAGVRRFQPLNQEKLYRKWTETLAREHCPAGQDIFLARDRSQGKDVLLWLDRQAPTDGASRATLGLLRGMGLKIVLIPDDLGKGSPAVGELQQMGVEVAHGPFDVDAWLRSNGRYVRFVWAGRPDAGARYRDCLRSRTKARVVLAHEAGMTEERLRSIIDGGRLIS